MIQLLPKPEEARVIRNALIAYVNDESDHCVLTAEATDICWKFISQISRSLVDEHGK